MFLQQRALSKPVASPTWDLSGAAGTETSFYVCPTGFQFIPIMLILHGWTSDPGAAVVTVGKTGGDCDEFLGDQTLSNITASYADEVAVLMPVPNATPVAGLILDAGETLGGEITTQGAGSCTVEVIGMLIAV